MKKIMCIITAVMMVGVAQAALVTSSSFANAATGVYGSKTYTNAVSVGTVIAVGGVSARNVAGMNAAFSGGESYGFWTVQRTTPLNTDVGAIAMGYFTVTNAVAAGAGLTIGATATGQAYTFGFYRMQSDIAGGTVSFNAYQTLEDRNAAAGNTGSFTHNFSAYTGTMGDALVIESVGFTATATVWTNTVLGFDNTQGGRVLYSGKVTGAPTSFSSTWNEGTAGLAELQAVSFVEVIPEPATFGMIALGGLITFAVRRMRSRA